MGLFRGDEEALEHDLQNKEGKSQQVDPGVKHAVFQQFTLGTECGGNGPHPDGSCRCQKQTQRKGRVNKEGKIPVCLLPVPGTQRFCYKGGAACAEHKAHGTEDHQHGHDQIDCRKRCFSGKV